MLEIVIPAVAPSEQWNEETQEFIYSGGCKEQKLQLEHSLLSLSKWESKWKKPFLSKGVRSKEEDLDYIKCMSLTPNIDPSVFEYLSRDNMNRINDYITDPMTATTIRDVKNGSRNSETYTAELFYYYMIALNIPFECQKWHLNRLITLIKVCSIKNEPPKKMGRRDVLSQYAAVNASRRKQLNSRG